MTSSAPPRKYQSALEPVDNMVDHVRGPASSPVIVEYGDYECPYSRQAYRQIERVETELLGGVRFAFRHFPLTQIHPHALAAAAAAEAAARRHRGVDQSERAVRGLARCRDRVSVTSEPRRRTFACGNMDGSAGAVSRVLAVERL